MLHGTQMNQDNLALAGLVVASFSFVISIATLYFTFLSKPKVKPNVGPYIKIYYADYEEGGGTGFYLPISFFNTSPNSALISRTAIEIHKKTNEQNRFLIFCTSYSELNMESNAWKQKEIAYSLPVLGKSSAQKTAKYYWSPDNSQKLIFEEGTYILTFLYWISGQAAPLHVKHEMIVSSSTIKKLNGYFESKKATTIEIMLDREIETNKLISLHESQKLLGDFS